MSPELAILDSVLGRLLVAKHDKTRHAALNQLKQSLATSPVEESIKATWSLLIRPDHGATSSDLNAIEKLLSHGLIRDDDIALKSIEMVTDPTCYMDPSCQLECIKIILASSGKKEALRRGLDALLKIIETAGEGVNKSAARAALIQILNEHRDEVGVVGWIAKLKVPSDSETVCAILDVIEKGKREDCINFVLRSCESSNTKVFTTILSMNMSAEFTEIVLNRLLLAHLHQDKLSNANTSLALRSNENKLLLLQWTKVNLANVHERIDLIQGFDPVAGPVLDLVCEWVLKKDSIPLAAGKVLPPSAVLENSRKALSKQAIETVLELIPKLIGAEIASSPMDELRRTRQEAVALFNRKPDLGLSFAVNSGLINGQSTGFLRNTRGLSKAALGEYLSNPEQKEKLEALLKTIDFEGLSFMEGLREFLQLFRLPGEAQKIDRMVEAFAEQYCRGERAEVKDTTLAYQLAFMMVMLNTDLHAPQISQRMTWEAFLTNCRGLENGNGIPEGLLHQLFDDIQRNEIQLAESFVISPMLGARPQERVEGSLVLSSLKPICSALGYIVEGGNESVLEVIEDLFSALLTSKLNTNVLLEAVLPKTQVKDLPWLYDLIDRYGDDFTKETWNQFLKTLSGFDPTACVDLKYNIREISLTTLEGHSLLALMEALSQKGLSPPFIKHWSQKLESLPACCLERLCVTELPRTLSILGRSFQHPGLRNSAFALITRICQEQLPVIEGNESVLPELTQVLVQLGLDPEPRVADESFNLFRLAADLVYTKHMTSRMGERIEDQDWSSRLYPILTGLSHSAIQQDNVVLSGNAIRILLEIVRQQGHAYSGASWRRLVRSSLAPILEDLGMQRGKLATDLALTTLNWLIAIVEAYPLVLIQETDFLDHILAWTRDLIKRPNEELAKSALVALNDLILKSYSAYQDPHWSQVTQVLAELLEWTMPSELLMADGQVGSSRLSLTSVMMSGSAASLDGDGFQVARYKCALHLLVLHSIKDLLTSDADPVAHLSMDNIQTLLTSLDQSATFAHSFNSNLALRTSLWQAGFLPIIDNILLAKQEAAAAQLSLNILFKVLLERADLKEQDPMKFKDDVEHRLRLMCLAILDHYIALLTEKPEVGSIKRSIKSWPPVITFLFGKLMQVLTVSWIGDAFQPALTVWKSDQGHTAVVCHEFLSSLANKYIKTQP